MASPAFAQSRGPLLNVWASWLSATVTEKVVDLPWRTTTERYTSRDLYLRNGDSTNSVYIDLRGATTIPESVTSTTNSIIQLDAGGEITLTDFVTDKLTFKAETGTASPVTVIFTY